MVEHIVNSIFNSMTYILPVGDSRDCWLVDCGDVEKVLEQGWRVRGVLLTHAHFDHIYGLNKLVEAFPDALVYTNEAGREGLMSPKWNFSKYHVEVDNFVFKKLSNVRILESDCTLILAEGMSVDVIFTPGHDSSCISYLFRSMMFTGDAYIPGIKTFQNFPRSNKQQVAESLNRLLNIEKTGVEIMPGHTK